MSDAKTAGGPTTELKPDPPAAPPIEPVQLKAELLPSMAEIAAAGRPDGDAIETTIYRPGVDDRDEADRADEDARLMRADSAAMPPAAPRGAGASARTSASQDFEVFRPTLYVVSLLAVLVTLSPFMDRSGKALLSTLDIGSRLNQIFFPLLFLTVVFAVGLDKIRAVGRLMRWPYLAFGLWLLPAVYFSLDPLLSARRTLFFVIQVVVACLSLLLLRSQRQLAVLLAIVASIVLVMCYVGVVTIPNLAIHQPTDAIEVDLAGDWRGVFKHKNEAGAIMALMVFLGLFVMRALNGFVGVTIALASIGFLAMTGSKSSMILLPVVLVLAFLVERCRGLTSRAIVALTLLVAFNVATLGSSFPGPIRTTLSRAMPDVTFTGRTDLWRFAIEHVAQRPLFGYGIGAFWRTSATMHKDREGAEPEDISGWVAELGTDSHNGYLDVAVSTGIPGLIFLVLSIVLWPVKDIGRAAAEPENRLLTRYYTRCWLFGLYLSAVETLLSPLNPVWFITLQAVFGLMLLSRFRLRAT